MSKLYFNTNYGILPKNVMKDNELSLGAKGVFAYLCAYAGSEDHSFPSRKLITYELNINKDTLTKYMKELQKNGYINIQQNKKEGQFANNIYYITPEGKQETPCPNFSDTEISDTKTSDTKKPATTNNKDTSNKDINNNNIYRDVINYLNQKANTNYRTNTTKTIGLINARVNEGFTVDDFKTVIDNKCSDWLGTDFEKFLRPTTLFGTKFESYLNEKHEIKPKKVVNYIPINESM